MAETGNGFSTNTNGAPTGNQQQEYTNEQLQRLENLIANATMFRTEVLRQLLEPRRDINRECDFPEGFVSSDAFQDLYEREAVASRVVEVMPKESWQVQPQVYEDEDPETDTKFEKAWKDLGNTLRGENSCYQDEEGSPIWEYILRADILSGIGQFAVILLGFDDGMDYSTPVGGVMDDSIPEVPKTVPEGGGNIGGIGGTGAPAGGVQQPPPFGTGHSPQGMQPDGRPVYPVGEAPYSPNPGQPHPYEGLDSSVRGTDRQYIGVPTEYGTLGAPPPKRKEGTKLLFMRVFPEVLVQVVQFESNIRSNRFGMPVRYMLTFNDPRLHEYTGVGLPIATVYVHWTRIIHIADNLQSSEVFGVPRMRPVLNNILNIRKMHAGPEGYWKSCFTGLALSTHPQLGSEVRINQAQVRDMVDDYQAGLKRALVLMGMQATTLAPSVVDPTGHINIQIQLICIQLGIPLRIFQGSERGNLASGQDDGTWNDRLRHRQQFYLTPRVIVPIVDRLIQTGVLPKPKGYTVHWPEIDVASAADKATVAGTKTTALGAYVAQNIGQLMAPLDFLTHVMGFDKDEAQSIIEDVQKHQEEVQQKAMDQQQQQHETDIAQQQDRIKAGVAVPPAMPEDPAQPGVKTPPAPGAKPFPPKQQPTPPLTDDKKPGVTSSPLGNSTSSSRRKPGVINSIREERDRKHRRE